MFIFSIKTSKRKILLILFAVSLAVLACFFFMQKNNKTTINSPIGKYTLCVKDNDSRVQFLKQFGWEVNPEPIEVSQVIIPSIFNETYEKYNNIQKGQGLNLAKYKESPCTRYTYQILNYKNYPGAVRANILVLNNKVIGGDICSTELNGFINRFKTE